MSATTGSRHGTFRVATWNLQRCAATKRRQADAQAQRMADVDADIWVLTETYVDRSPGADFAGVHSPPHPTRRSTADERFTSIWSRWPIVEVGDPASRRRGTIAATVTTPFGPLIVYGTVIPYAHERHHDDGRPATSWEVHLAEIGRQEAEWNMLRTRHPDVPLIVAGDMNQARSGRPRAYGTTNTRAALTGAMQSAGLRCLTEGDFVAAGVLQRSSVEHILVSNHLSGMGPALVWDRSDTGDRKLSDHPTVAVDLTVAH